MAKKRKLSHIPNRTHPDRPRAKSSASQPSSKHPKSQSQINKKNQPHKHQQHEKPTIPFTSHERILLVGEGDLSFAASLVKHHGCTNVTATVLEKSREELELKYPHVGENIKALLAKEEEQDQGGSADTDGDDGEGSDEEDAWNSDDDDEQVDTQKKHPPNNRIFYNIDATKPLPSTLIPFPGFNTIIFNFPHVGGLSTDVNRQVRHNQSLLVSFFTSVLSHPKSQPLHPSGSIVITLFEAEPYTLWNIKDLARHAGLAVEKSFRFQAEAYPGYKHARTCGVIEGKGGAWKGEERKARSYVFRRKEEVGAGAKKRKKGTDSDDDD